MTFELTDELLDSIISAMDNQDEVYVVDAAKGVLVQRSGDEQNYYSLPEWKPADGFSIRESFVNELHAPLAREELQNVLHSGRGVFKNFRNTLKEYPEVDKRWHIFKHRIMSARINEWYNSLREIWGLEKLDQLPESDETLVHDDFTFRVYNPQTDEKTILLNVSRSFSDDEELPLELSEAIYKMWRERFAGQNDTETDGYICQSLSDEFAGCITASSEFSSQDKIVFITSLFVAEQFRGLGIGTELISMCIARLQTSGKQWVVFPSYITPEILQPLLIRTGFKKFSSGYFLQLSRSVK